MIWSVNDLAAGADSCAFTAPDGRKVPIGYIVQEGSKPVACCIESLERATLLAEAPAMLAALRFALDNLWQHESRLPQSAREVLDNTRAILARIDGTPTAQPTSNTPVTLSDLVNAAERLASAVEDRIDLDVASLRAAKVREIVASLAQPAPPTEGAEWNGSPDPTDPDNFWIDDATGERVCATCGARHKREG